MKYNNSSKMNFSLSRLIVMLIMLTVAIVGGTFAWFTFSSKQSALVLTIGDINDTQIKLSPYQIKGEMTPVNTYTSGVFSEVEVTNGNRTTSVVLYYKINDLDVELIDNGLAYTIVNAADNSTVKTGYFSDLIDTSETLPESVVILDQNTTVDSTTNYKVYLWLDSTKGNQNDVQGSSLDIELNGSIGSVTISGTNTYGQQLTANVIDTNTEATYTYQWFASDTNSTIGGTAISEVSTTNKYTIGSGLAGKYIYVVAKAIEDYYDDRTYTDVTDVDNNGSATVSSKTATLKVTPTSINLTYPSVNSNTLSYTYDGDGVVSCKTADSSVATCSVDTTNKKVIVTSVSSGSSTTLTLEATVGTDYAATISNNVTVNVVKEIMTAGTVTISGTSTYNETLTATVNPDTSPVADSYSYQWWYATSATATSGTNISGATSSTYKIGNNLVGKYIGVTVTAKKTNYNDVLFSDITSETVSKANLTITAKDQTITYGSSIATGTGQITSTGLVSGYSVTSVILTPSTSSVTTNGTIIPSDAVIKNGTVDVTSNYNITYTAGKLVINAKNASNFTITLSPTSYTYDETAKTPTVTVKDGSTILTNDTHYAIAYSNNTNVGTATVTVTGKGNYTGTKTSTFTISKASCVCTISSTPTLKYLDSLSGNISYSCTGDGTISVVSSASDIITVGTAGISSTILTGLRIGTSTITVSQAAGSNYNACTSDTEDVTVSGSSYTVTADAQGGTISSTTGWTIASDGTTATKSVIYNSTYGTLPSPTRTGYTFNGWYDVSSGGNKIESTTTVSKTAAHTIYAQWIPNTYTITYFLGNATSTAGATQLGTSTCTYDATCTLTTFADLGGIFPHSSADNTTNGNANYGWAFYGWGTSISDKSKNYSNGAEFAYTTEGNLNLYAIGRRYFYFNAGIAPISRLASKAQYWNPYSNASSQLSSITIVEPTAIDGWEFVGYKASNAASTSSILYDTDDIGTTITPDYNNTSRTLRSVYKRTLTLTYNANGGSGTVSNTAETQYYNSGYGNSAGDTNTGARVSTPTFTLATNSFTKTGYIFSKWADGSTSGTQYDAGVSYTGFAPAVDNTTTTKTMYAIWNGSYIINYSCGVGSGTAPTSQTVNYGGNYTVPSNTCTAPAGYSFSTWKDPTSASWDPGWSTNSWPYVNGQYGISNNSLTLTAYFTPKTYTVKYSCGTGSGTAPSSQTVAYGSSITINGDGGSCAKAGYTFNGWYDPTNVAWTGWNGTWKYSGTQYGIVNDSELTLTAQWVDSTAPIIENIVVASNLFPTKSPGTIKRMTISGNVLTTTDADPYMIFSDLKIPDTSKVIVTFGTAISTEFRFQIFYATSGTSFSEANSVKTTVAAGTTKFEVTLPGGTYTALRFDFGNDSGLTFNVAGIDVVGGNVSNVIYLNADLVDYGSKVSHYAVTTSSGTPTSWTDITDTSRYHLRYKLTASETKYYVWAKDAAGISGGPIYEGFVKVSYNSGNLVYGLSDGVYSSSVNAPNANHSISNKVVTVTATADDGYVYTPGRVYLEANKTYKFNCDSTGTWGGGGDSVEAFLMLNGDMGTYYRMASKTNYSFTPTVSGVYWLRLDVNQSGKSYTFSNINISYTVDDDDAKLYGTDLFLSSVVPTRSGYAFKGWSTTDGAASATYTAGGTYSTNASATLYAVWKLNNPVESYICANGSAGSSPYLINYSGNCTVINDGNDNWRIKFLSAGTQTLTLSASLNIDLFLVGGGGGGDVGKYTPGSIGGGGGYTQSISNIFLDASNSYDIIVGSGGKSVKDGGDTSAFGYIANGGKSGTNGGYGAGNGGTSSNINGGSYGSGQGYTSCEFGEGTTSGCTNGDEYAYGGGGGYGGVSSSGGIRGGGGGVACKTGSGSSGMENTGGGGSGGACAYMTSSGIIVADGGSGGSGIVIIRNKR